MKAQFSSRANWSCVNVGLHISFAEVVLGLIGSFYSPSSVLTLWGSSLKGGPRLVFDLFVNFSGCSLEGFGGVELGLSYLWVLFPRLVSTLA